MKIDTTVEVPEVHAGRRGYPFPELRVGDSFFVNATGVSVSYRRKKTGHGYTTRKVTESGQRGVRVWRTV